MFCLFAFLCKGAGGGEGGGGLSKSSKPINGLSSIICNLCQGYGNILYMYVLPDEQTDCPILNSSHTLAYK